MAETQAQQIERILQHLVEVQTRTEQDIATTSDDMLKRIEVDAATIVTLSIVTELLPESIQRQVQYIINLHEKVWNADSPSTASTTPRKPLGQRLIRRLVSFTRATEEKSSDTPKTPSLVPPPS